MNFHREEAKDANILIRGKGGPPTGKGILPGAGSNPPLQMGGWADVKGARRTPNKEKHSAGGRQPSGPTIGREGGYKRGRADPLQGKAPFRGQATVRPYRTNPMMAPTSAQPTLTRSLFSHFQPRTCSVGVPQVCRGCFSVSLLHCGQW